MTLATYVPHEDGRRNYSKVDYCLFCGRGFAASLRSHLLSSHRNEPRVQEVEEIPLKSKERKHAFMLLRNEGNFLHNTKVRFDLLI